MDGGSVLQEKLWTKDFVRLSIVSLFMYLVFYSLMVVVAFYALQQLHASNAAAGLASGDFLLAALIARLLAGHSIERIGKRRMMLWGLFLYGLLQGIYFLAGNIYLFAVIRFFMEWPSVFVRLLSLHWLLVWCRRRGAEREWDISCSARRWPQPLARLSGFLFTGSMAL